MIMSGMTKFFAGFATAFVAIGIAGGVTVWSGLISVSALNESGLLDRVLGYASTRSIAHHAETATNPFANNPEVLSVGLAHYKENCLACHAASGVERSEFSRGLNPPAPRLTAPSIQAASDGELFWVVSNGIQSTGMPAFSPTHDKDEIWKIVAFVRHLPQLSPAETNELKSQGVDQESHHHEDSGH
jgi:mono/diheme cytochrome c family protein